MNHIDLHTHSNRSDGSLSPARLVEYAKQRGLSAMALTDHDTVSGVAEALEQGKITDIEIVPGIEFSARSGKETHILGFFIDHENGTLLKKLDELRETRITNAKEICKRLRGLGFEIYAEKIILKLKEGESIGRVHIANEMIDKGYVSSVSEAFEKYIGSGKPAYYTRPKSTDVELISVIRKAGGAAFLAHPYSTGKRGEELVEYISYLKENGLSGIECLYSEYTPEERAGLLKIAERLDLLVSGGTDFHGENKPELEIGIGHGDLEIEYGILEKIKNKTSRI